jgi:hypothetical protein
VDTTGDSGDARDIGGRFAPGHRKLGGRKRRGRNRVAADVRRAAQAHTTDAVDVLAAIMGDAKAPTAARVAAANALLDRAHGRPAQAITGPEGGPLEVNVDAVRDLLAAKLERLAGIAGATVAIVAGGLGHTPDATKPPPAPNAGPLIDADEDYSGVTDVAQPEAQPVAQPAEVVAVVAENATTGAPGRPRGRPGISGARPASERLSVPLVPRWAR